MLLPRELVRAHVEGRKHADARERQPPKMPAVYRSPAGGRRSSSASARNCRCDPRADVEVSARGIVRAGRPVRAAADAGFDRHVASVQYGVKILPPFTSLYLRCDLHRLRHERVARRIRLRLRGRLPRLLRHGPLLDADERLAVRAIEDVDPARLARLGDALAQRPSSSSRTAPRGSGRRSPRCRGGPAGSASGIRRSSLEGDDRRREQVVAGAHAAVEVGARLPVEK